MRMTGIGKATLLILAIGMAIGGYRLFGSLNGQSSADDRGALPSQQLQPTQNPAPNTEAPVAITLNGKIGGEKAGRLDDAEITTILSRKYGLSFQVSTVGSLDMVRGSVSGQDFLWPSSQVAFELFQSQGGSFKRSEVIFNSPIVLYSWDTITEVLMRQKIVQRVGAIYYIVDLPKLVGLMNANKRWKDIGIPNLYGPISVVSTDPNRSNSGMMFAGLLANILNGGEVVDEKTVQKTLPALQKFYRRLGYMQSGSGDLFEQYIHMGEGQYPLMVGYENQIVQYQHSHPEFRALIQQRIRVLYPRPTVWTSHPLIALNERATRVIKAFKDREIQQLVWKKHGFRTGTVLASSANRFAGIPERIETVIPMPKPSVMAIILASLKIN